MVQSYCIYFVTLCVHVYLDNNTVSLHRQLQLGLLLRTHWREVSLYEMTDGKNMFDFFFCVYQEKPTFYGCHGNRVPIG